MQTEDINYKKYWITKQIEKENRFYPGDDAPDTAAFIDDLMDIKR